MNMTELNDPIMCDPALNMARQSLYRFAALSLLDPREGPWKQLDALRHDRTLFEAASLLRTLPHAEPETLGPGERARDDLDPAPVLDRLPHSPALLNEAFESTFGLLVSGPCPPYETEYIPSKFAFQRSNTLADVNGFYRAFGLVTTSRHPARADHCVLELEFMAFLLGMERQASSDPAASGKARMQVCREAQARFLREHVSWWIPAFAKLLSRENPGGFYDAIGCFLASFVPVERALCGVEVPTKTRADALIAEDGTG